MFGSFSVKAWAKKRKCFHNELHSVCNTVCIHFKRSFTCDLCNVVDVGQTTGYLAGASKKIARVSLA